MKRTLSLLTLLAVFLIALTACDNTDTQNNKGIRELKLVVTAENISQLEDYPNLKRVDLTGSTCYEAIVAYMQKHPDVEVTYTVDVGAGTTLSGRDAALTLNPGSFDFDTLVKNIPFLPKAKTLHMPEITLTAAQLQQLKNAAPGLYISYTIEFDGAQLSSSTSRKPGV